MTPITASKTSNRGPHIRLGFDIQNRFANPLDEFHSEMSIASQASVMGVLTGPRAKLRRRPEPEGRGG
eukprot:3659893-Rhodomonas_salina.3